MKHSQRVKCLEVINNTLPHHERMSVMSAMRAFLIFSRHSRIQDHAVCYRFESDDKADDITF